jgi:hypothetical protein
MNNIAARAYRRVQPAMDFFIEINGSPVGHRRSTHVVGRLYIKEEGHQRPPPQLVHLWWK